MVRIITILLALIAPFLVLRPTGAAASDEVAARAWIAAASDHSAAWVHASRFVLPEGKIFVGDPSWGDDYHLRGAREVPVRQLEIWFLVGDAEPTVHAVWLEAGGTLPASSGAMIEFGMDSAYFAFGDLATGRDLATIGDLGIAEVPSNFEFFLPHIQRTDFTWLTLEVPPRGGIVHAVNTRNDGGLKAVWLHDGNDGFSGILIDISGRASDRQYIDTLLAPER
jgi:hypothetical protein